MRILFCGDYYVHEGHPASVDLDPAVVDLFARHAIRCCNFEGPLRPPGAPGISKAGPHIAQHPQAAALVRSWGFDLFCLANNHSFDYGDAGLQATLTALGPDAVVGAGPSYARAYAPVLREVEGIRVAFLAFCEAEFGALVEAWPRSTGDRGGYAWVNHPRANALVRAARAQADFVVVQVHAGVEELDVPLPEWRQRYRELVELGADAVVAHHPHVPLGHEVFQGKPIFYSLGNFFFPTTSPQDLLWSTGLALSLSLSRGQSPTFEVIPLTFGERSLRPASDPAIAAEIQRRSAVLADERYLPAVRERVLQIWAERYCRYFTNAGLALTRPGRVLGFEQRAQLLLLHNLRIESHRWAAERALSLLAETARP